MEQQRDAVSAWKYRMESWIGKAHQAQKSALSELTETAGRLTMTGTDRFYESAMTVNSAFWSGVSKAAKLLEKGDNSTFAPVGTEG